MSRSPRSGLWLAAILAGAAICLPAPSSLLAQTYWAPPSTPERVVPPTAPRVLLHHFVLGDVSITFNETTLAAVQRAFPGAQYGQSGDAGGYLRWLCYVMPPSRGRSVLWLESDEMGGGKWIMGFTLVQAADSAQIDSRCGQLPPSAALILPRSLRLGTSRRDVTHLLGRPSFAQADTLVYSHEHHVAPKKFQTNDYGYDVTSKATLVLRRGRVAFLSVWYLEST